MIKRIACFFILTASLVTACGNQSGSATGLEGSWRLVNDSASACPDVISFGSNGKYFVLNDCYGEDPRHPVTESGTWQLDENETRLTLQDRQFKTNHYLGDLKSDPLLIELVEPATGEDLTFKYVAQGKAEQFIRVQKEK